MLMPRSLKTAVTVGSLSEKANLMRKDRALASQRMRTRWMGRLLMVVSTVFIALTITVSGRAEAGKNALVMVEREGCAWCTTWHQVIGPIYPKTEEGQRFPLLRVDLDEDRPETKFLREGVRYTPTFIVLRCGKEAGRILGYPGEANFWGLLATIIKDAESNGGCAG